MSKNIKLVMLTTLISTTLIIVASMLLVLTKTGGNGSANNGDLKKIAENQIKQSDQIDSVKSEYSQKIEVQNKLLKEYDKKLVDLEETQSEIQKNVNKIQGVEVTEEKKEEKVETPAEQPTQQPAITTMTTNSVDGVNLRNITSSTGNRVELIPNNQQVTVLEGPVANEGYNWYKVQSASGGVGWVAQEYMK